MLHREFGVGGLASSGIPVLRNREAQVPAQRAGLVLSADHAALAQDGHHLVEEPPELGGVPDVDVGPVQGALGERPGSVTCGKR